MQFDKNDKDNFIRSNTKERVKNLFGNWYGLLIIVVFTIVVGTILINFDNIMRTLKLFAGYLRPVIIGVCLAYILNPLKKRFEIWFTYLYKKIRKRERLGKRARNFVRYSSITVTMIILVLIVIAFFQAVFPSIVKSVMNLVTVLPEKASEYYKNMYAWVNDSKHLSDQVKEFLLGAVDSMDKSVRETFVPWLQNNLVNNVNSYATKLANGVISVFSILLNMIIGFIVTIYILASTEKFSASAKKNLYGLFNKRQAEIILHYSRLTNEMFGGFLTGKIIDSFFLGIVCLIYTSITHTPYAMLISLIMGVTNMIPIFGQYIGAIPSLLLVLIISPVKCLSLLIFIVIMKQIDGNIIGPALIGNSTGLSAFWVLFAILLFGGLFGIIGMIIGVPLFAVFYTIFNDYIDYRLVRKSLDKRHKRYYNLKRIEVDEEGKNTYIKYTPEELRYKELREEEEHKINLSTIMFSNEVLREHEKKKEFEKKIKSGSKDDILK
ncbi:MAG: AI-2E family transporter [Lachnospiraceae bacterium]|nr:AI-2E family transporter [Lachnospiraceae bacterium]